jgi:hypothetical protein
MVAAITTHWKALATALVAVAAVFGVGLPEDFVNHSTELAAEGAAGAQAAYAAGATLVTYLKGLKAS